MTNLADLESWVDRSIQLASEHNYHPTIFMKMRSEYGTVRAIEKLVLSGGEAQSGFTKLAALNLLQWTIEQAVLSFPDQFPNRELQKAARWRLDRAQRP